MVLINCDPFHSFSFLFISYSLKQLFRSVHQIFTKSIRKGTYVLEFFLKKQRMQAVKKGLNQSFFPLKTVKFFRTASFQNNFRWMFLFREVGLTWSCQSNKCLIWLTKQINTFTSNQSYLVKYLVQKKPEDSTVKCL